MKISSKKVIPLFLVLALLAISVGYLIRNTNIFQNAATCTVNCPPVITNSAVSNLTSNSVTITWNTDVPANSAVLYLPSTGGVYTTPTDPAMVTFHSVTITGLNPSTHYTYKAKSYASNGQGAQGPNNLYFITLAQGATPIISSVTSSNITQTGATITWITDIPADTQVEYGTTVSYGSTTTLDSTQVTSHTVTLSGLTAGTPYYYRVKSSGVTSIGQTFTTLANIVDTTKPIVSITSPAKDSTVSGITTITANASDNVGVIQVEFYNGLTLIGTDTSSPYSVSWDTTQLSNASTTIKAKAYDGAGNSTSTSNRTIYVLNQDPAPLPTFSSISVSNLTTTGATILWTTDIPSTTQVEYGTTINYGFLTTLNSNQVTSHGATLSGLSSSTIYHYRVKSGNANGVNTSLDGTFTTLAGTSPLVISNVASSNITSSTATITWTTNDLSDSQVEYGTTISYGSSTTLNTNGVLAHSVSLSGLSPNTLYHYRVKSKINGGQVVNSNDYTFTTSNVSPGAGDPIVRNIDVVNITGTTATIKWNTDNVASTSQVLYGISNTSLSTPLDWTQVNLHTVNLTGLALNTTYNYRVISNTSMSPIRTFTTTTGTPPFISQVTTTSIKQDGATITWITDQIADSQIEYGLTNSYGNFTSKHVPQTAYHSKIITGLAPSTTYHYRVRSGTSVSADKTFTTAPYSLKFAFTIGKIDSVFDLNNNVVIFKPNVLSALTRMKNDGFKDIHIINPFMKSYIEAPSSFPTQNVQAIQLLIDQGFNVMFTMGIPFIDGSGSADSWMYNYYPGGDLIGHDDDGGLPEYIIRMTKFMDALKEANILDKMQFALGGEPNSTASSAYMPLSQYQQLTATNIEILKKPEYGIPDENINCCSWTSKLVSGAWPASQASWWDFASTQMNNPLLQNFDFSFNWYPHSGIGASATHNTTANIQISPMPQGAWITELNVDPSLTLNKLLGLAPNPGYRTQETLKNELLDIISYANAHQFGGVSLFSFINSNDAVAQDGSVGFGFFRESNSGCPSWEYKVLLEVLQKPINFGSCPMPIISTY